MRHEFAYERLPDLVGFRVAGDAEAELRDHVASCDVCVARLAHLERVALGLQSARDARQQPLDALAMRILDIPVTEPQRPAGRLRRRLVPTGVGLAVAASIAALVLALTRSGPPAAVAFEARQTVTLRAVASQVSGIVELGRPSGATRAVRVKIRGLPMDGARAFDLWLVGASGAMRAGSFGPGEDGSCVVDLAVPRDERWDRIAVTRSGSGPDGQVLASS